MIVIHGAFDVAVHAQPDAVSTWNVCPTAPAVGGVALDGLSWYVQPPACVTVKVFPPAVIVPTRCGPVLAATEYVTVPVPVPEAPPVTVIHVSFETAVQPQVAAVCT